MCNAANRTYMSGEDCMTTSFPLTLLPELWLAFLDCGHDHVTNSSSRKTVQTPLDAFHRDDVQVLGT